MVGAGRRRKQETQEGQVGLVKEGMESDCRLSFCKGVKMKKHHA